RGPRRRSSRSRRRSPRSSRAPGRMCSMPARCSPWGCSRSGRTAASSVHWVACSHSSIACTCSTCSSGVPSAATPATSANTRVRSARSSRAAGSSRASAFSASIARSSTTTTRGACRWCAPPGSSSCSMSGRTMPEAKMDGCPLPTGRLTHRRLLRIVAAVAGLPPMIAAVRASAPKPRLHSWNGDVLGALSEITLWHPDAAFARRTILRVRQEIDRLEKIFSLYRPDSEVSRLNGAGRLTKPSPELRTLVEESQRLGVLSGGALDISVQPLWRLYEAHFWSRTEVQPDIAARARDVAQALVDFRRIDNGAKAIGFTRPGMAITLNSIAQGYITDVVADLLRNEGFESAVVNLGEYRTIG